MKEAESKGAKDGGNWSVMILRPLGSMLMLIASITMINELDNEQAKMAKLGLSTHLPTLTTFFAAFQFFAKANMIACVLAAILSLIIITTKQAKKWKFLVMISNLLIVTLVFAGISAAFHSSGRYMGPEQHVYVTIKSLSGKVNMIGCVYGALTIPYIVSINTNRSTKLFSLVMTGNLISGTMLIVASVTGMILVISAMGYDDQQKNNVVLDCGIFDNFCNGVVRSTVISMYGLFVSAILLVNSIEDLFKK
ncbi:hypothetical protein ACFE04_013102 [Oxalis oulophora]